MKDRIKVNYTELLAETFSTMSKMGLLLVSCDANGKPNAMAIGWGTIGIIWGKPIFAVLVRPSRYTHGLIEVTGDFTVNVPTAELSDAVMFCGTVSGKDHDKFKEKGLTAVHSNDVKSPIIDECIIHYECKVVHKNYVLKENIFDDGVLSAYRSGDFHTIYYGEILGTYAVKGIIK